MSGLNHFLMHEVEMPLVPVVATMEEVGYPVDCDFFHELRGRVEPERQQLVERIQKLAGENFNPDSSKQLSRLLYKELGLPIVNRTQSGAPSTDGKTLKCLAPRHEIIHELLRLRTLKKVLSTYCTIPDKTDPDGRLRVEFNQLAAETGRFSSPSVIQTIPKKKDVFGLRKGFRTPEGFKIVGGDFRQQELNVLAQVSRDPGLLSAIKDGVDLHCLAAVKVFRLDCEANQVEEKYPEKREQIKAIQFGLIYGKSAYGLAADLGISREEAEQLIADYFKQFPAVQKFIAKIHRDLFRQGYVDDVFGRRRHFPVVKRKASRKRYKDLTEPEKKLINMINKARRESQNFVIQGASATITKLAMIRCYRHITEKYTSKIKMILTLHDEVQFEVSDELVDEFAAELPNLMCNLGLERFGFKLPLAVEVKVGPSWGEMMKWKGCQDGATDPKG